MSGTDALLHLLDYCKANGVPCIINTLNPKQAACVIWIGGKQETCVGRWIDPEYRDEICRGLHDKVIRFIERVQGGGDVALAKYPKMELVP